MLTIRPIDYKELDALVSHLNEQFSGSCRLQLSDDCLMPFLDYGSAAAAGDAAIVFSSRMDIVLTLFTAHPYEPQRLGTILPLYLIANRHVEAGNWYNAEAALKALEKETMMLAIDPTHTDLPDEMTFYLDMQAEAMLLHEYGHYAFRRDPRFLDHIKQVVTEALFDDLPRTPANRYFTRLLQRNGQVMEELSCDWFAMTILADRLGKRSLTEDEIGEVIHQVVRMYASLELLAEAHPVRKQSMKKGYTKRAFDVARPALVSLRATADWDGISAQAMVEEMKAAQTRTRAIRRSMTNLTYYRMRKDIPSDVSDKQRETTLALLEKQEQTLFQWYAHPYDANDEYISWRTLSAFSKINNLLDDIPESDKKEVLNDIFSKFL